MNKKLGISIGLVVIAVIVGPVLWYGGLSVDTATVNMYFGFSSGIIPTEKSKETIEGQILQLDSVDTSVQKQNVYTYMMTRVRGKTKVEEQTSTGDAVVDIQITFNLTTPSNQSLVRSFDPQELKGMGKKVVSVTMGSEELKREKGTFHLRITISISINPPAGPSQSLNLTPVSLSFTIPRGQT